MAQVQPESSVVEMLRARAGTSPRLRALDSELLRVVDELETADFDEVATHVGDNPKLRDGLAAWFVSARTRGLVVPLAPDGGHQRFAVTSLGRKQLVAGG